MELIIQHSKTSLPVMFLSDNWALEVVETKDVLLSNRRGYESFEVVSRGRYNNLDKAKKTLNEEEFKTLLKVMRTNCLLPTYLVDNKLVKEDSGKFVATAPDSKVVKHYVGGEPKREIKPTTFENNIGSWSKIVMTSPRPEPVSCRYKPGTAFLLESDLWILVSTTFITGTSSMLCIHGDNKGQSAEYLTDFINDLIPAEVKIEVA